MAAKSPQEICSLFKRYMGEGDIDSLIDLYDHEAVFLNREGQFRKGLEAIREELTPFARMKTVFDFKIKQVIEADNIALIHTQWQVLAREPMSVYAMEVARRQPDGSWRWLIGDPFTVGRQNA